MAQNVIAVDAADVVGGLTLKLEVRRAKSFAGRAWLAARIVGLAAWVAGTKFSCTVTVE
jgi:hypothetical protein